MTPFAFEHVFAAPSPAALFAAYFDPDHQQAQDRAVDIIEREILELVDRGDEVYRVCRVVPRRQLPSLLKPFASGPLHYIEKVTWRRATNEIHIEIAPSVMKGRARIQAVYRVESAGPGSIRRSYTGEVSVDVALLANRVEKGIVAEFSRSLPIAAAATQAWLARQSSRSVTAQT